MSILKRPRFWTNTAHMCPQRYSQNHRKLQRSQRWRWQWGSLKRVYLPELTLARLKLTLLHLRLIMAEVDYWQTPYGPPLCWLCQLLFSCFRYFEYGQKLGEIGDCSKRRYLFSRLYYRSSSKCGRFYQRPELTYLLNNCVVPTYLWHSMNFNF